MPTPYWSTGDMGRIITLCEATLADCERVLGPDDPAALFSRSSLAGVCRQAGNAR